MPALDLEATQLFSTSERLLQEYIRGRDGFSAKDLKQLIQDVLHHPDFKASEVDHDMHARLMEAVEEGHIQVHDMLQEGDGEQDLRFFKRPVENVLRELLADERLAGMIHNSQYEFTM